MFERTPLKATTNWSKWLSLIKLEFLYPSFALGFHKAPSKSWRNRCEDSYLRQIRHVKWRLDDRHTQRPDDQADTHEHTTGHPSRHRDTADVSHSLVHLLVAGLFRSSDAFFAKIAGCGACCWGAHIGHWKVCKLPIHLAPDMSGT